MSFQKEFEQLAEKYTGQMRNEAYRAYERQARQAAADLVDNNPYDAFTGLVQTIQECLEGHLPEPDKIEERCGFRFSYFSEIKLALTKLVSENKQMKAKLAELEGKTGE